MSRYTLAPAATAFCLAASMALAQDTSDGVEATDLPAPDASPSIGCTLTADAILAGDAPDILGTYQTFMGVGVATMSGRTVPLPDQGTAEPTTLSIANDALFISGGPVFEGEVELRAWRDGLNFDLPEGSPLDPEDVAQNDQISAEAGCDIDTLPQLQGGGSYTGPEGEVDFDLYFVVLSERLIYGITVGTLNGGEGVARRIVELRR